MQKIRLIFILSACALLSGKVAFAQSWQLDGNLKARALVSSFPHDSVLRDSFDSESIDLFATSRINARVDQTGWSGEIAWQLIGLTGDSIEQISPLAIGPFPVNNLQNDELRFFDLSDTIEQSSDSALLHRLDRLNIGWQSERNVVRLGRQAVSWGNGLIFTPMDFFNPFDPSAIDTEYKPGDDIFYAQHLLANGDDLQLVWVGRRDPFGSRSSDVSSLAVKYHRFIGSNEIDLLLAEHYADTIVAIGGTASVGGAVVRGDWVMTDTQDDQYHSLVMNLSYSWVAAGKNISASVEYFHNGFGLRGESFSVARLAGNSALAKRLERGELFTLGRDYIGASALVEMSALWLLTPNLFLNLGDESALVQLVSQHDLSQNSQALLALSVPLGPNGTEYGGLALTPVSQAKASFVSRDWSLFAQLAWYF